jgi:hypothetical protein
MPTSQHLDQSNLAIDPARDRDLHGLDPATPTACLRRPAARRGQIVVKKPSTARGFPIFRVPNTKQLNHGHGSPRCAAVPRNESVIVF